MNFRSKLFFLLGFLVFFVALSATDFYVETTGSDSNPGTKSQPFATLVRAQQASRSAEKPVTIFIGDGTHRLSEPLILTPLDSGKAGQPTLWRAKEGCVPVISGGEVVTLHWEKYQNGIFQAETPQGFQTDQLFINGKSQTMARYPNRNPEILIFEGSAADAISPERVAQWKDPTGGFFHAMHPSMWGGYSYRILGKNENGALKMEGGWQNNRGTATHKQHQFVENIFEELDAPGEWYLDSKNRKIYWYPDPGTNPQTAVVEAVRLRNLIELKGTLENPVRFVQWKGITFRHAARTFMETKEPVLRTDWTIYRGGALFLNGTEECSIEDCDLDQLGGNAIFVNDYNRRLTIRGTHISKAGASGIIFLGDTNAVRNPLLNYNSPIPPLDQIDRTPGPKTENYPADCLVEDCLIDLTGRVEKQSAGINIDMSQSITIRHCSIYDMPRAGINIGDGCWGGHLIEECDVFDTVKETGDHGSFNSWGRDRFWQPDIKKINSRVQEAPELPLLDVVKPNIIRNSRWRCDHGWDIDLDDGSSHYEIYGNLCLRNGIKLREGYKRTVTQNVLVTNSLNPHCWLVRSGDIFRNNIVWMSYRSAVMPSPPWEQDLDQNFMQMNTAKVAHAEELSKGSGKDRESMQGDAYFMNPSVGDYRLRENSPALALGIKSLPFIAYGVQKPSLRAIARTPSFQVADMKGSKRDSSVQKWLGAEIRNIRGEGEMSAYGLPGEVGILILSLSKESPLTSSGILSKDVILNLNGQKTDDLNQLLTRFKSLTPGQEFSITVMRNQQPQTFKTKVPSDFLREADSIKPHGM
ncbi:MAG: PDZ domain-containing protein [Verrucomicrobiota bacterium]